MFQVFKQDANGFSVVSEHDNEDGAIAAAQSLPLDSEIRVEERNGGISRTVLVLTPQE